MIKKKIYKYLILLPLIFFTSCGYKAIYSSNEKIEINIKEIKLIGNENINNNILSILNINNNIDEENNIIFILESSLKNNTTSKDSAGNPLTYQMIVDTKLTLQKNDKKIKEQNFNASFTYTNKENKFDLQKLRNDTEQNLTRIIANKILIFLKVSI